MIMITVTDIIFCILMLVLIGVMAYGCVRCGDERRGNDYTMSIDEYDGWESVREPDGYDWITVEE